MNGPHTPVFMKQNRFTNLMERIAEQNAMEGKPAGRSTEQFMNASPVLTAKRYGVDKKTGIARGPDFSPEPEDPMQAMRASAQAAALGIGDGMGGPTYDDDMPGDIGRVSGERGPSDAEIDAMLARAGQKLPGNNDVAQGAADPASYNGPASAGRQVALPHGRPQTNMGVARQMPNFANVEGFDLTRKVAVVDGMEFRLADIDVVAMKKFAIQVVLDNVTFQLAEALVALGIPADMAQSTADQMRAKVATEATNGEAVLSVQGGEAPGAVLPGPNETGRSGVEVQSVPNRVEQQPAAATSSVAVQPDTQVSGAQSQVLIAALRPSDDASMLLGDGGDLPE